MWSRGEAVIPLARAGGVMASKFLWGNCRPNRVMCAIVQHHQPASPAFLRTSIMRTLQSSADRGDGGYAAETLKQKGTKLSEWGRLGAKAEPRSHRTVVPAAERLVVIGDVHGDIGGFRVAFGSVGPVDSIPSRSLSVVFFLVARQCNCGLLVYKCKSRLETPLFWRHDRGRNRGRCFLTSNIYENSVTVLNFGTFFAVTLFTDEVLRFYW